MALAGALASADENTRRCGDIVEEARVGYRSPLAVEAVFAEVVLGDATKQAILRKWCLDRSLAIKWRGKLVDLISDNRVKYRGVADFNIGFVGVDAK